MTSKNTHGGRRDNHKRRPDDKRGGRRVAGPGKKLGRPKKMTQYGAIEMVFNYDGGEKRTEYVILPIHEIRGSTRIFAIHEGNGTHLMDAASIRGSWNAWVGELVDDEQIVETVPPGIETY